MRLHRFFIDTPLRGGSLHIEHEELCHQLLKVLRMKKGDTLILVHAGREATARIDDLTSGVLTVCAEEPTIVVAEPARHVTLLCAVLKRENMEWVAQKATEAGVKEIVPLLTERTIKTGLRIDRLDRIAREAAEQSGRGLIPVIHEPMSFEAALAAKPTGRTDVFLHTGHGALPWTTAVKSAQFVGCHIGPEGGWTEKEAELALAHGASIGTLGPLILRGETAAIIASYLAVHSE